MPHEIALRDALVASRTEEQPEVKQQAAMILVQEGKLRESRLSRPRAPGS